LLSFRRIGLITEEPAECGHVLPDLADREIGAVPPEDFRSGSFGDDAQLVHVAQHELPRLRGLALAWQRRPALALDVRPADAIHEPEVLPPRRRHSDIEPSDQRDPLEPCDGAPTNCQLLVAKGL